jgi:hypothetical protein
VREGKVNESAGVDRSLAPGLEGERRAVVAGVVLGDEASAG